MRPFASVVAALAVLVVVAGAVKDVQRVSNLSLGRFVEFMNRGEPVVVTDVQANMPIAKWTCDSLAQDYPNEPIEVFYAGERLQSTLGADWQTVLSGASRDALDDGDTVGATVPSFLWFPVQNGAVRRDLGSNLTQARVEELYGSWHLPYFLPRSALNAQAMRDRLEVFAGVADGSGTRLHVDEMCANIFSMQLAGKKRWFLGPMPNNGDSFQAVNDNLGSKFNHTYETVLSPGDTLFFPHSFVHGTATEPDSGCSVSASLQYWDPLPGGFLRRSIASLTHAEEQAHCYFAHWAEAVTSKRSLLQRVTPPRRRRPWTGARLYARETCAGIDANADGEIAPGEFGGAYAVEFERFVTTMLTSRAELGFSTELNVRERRMQAFVGSGQERAASLWPTFRDYHDENGDGVVAAEECIAGIAGLVFELRDATGAMTSAQAEKLHDDDPTTAVEEPLDDDSAANGGGVGNDGLRGVDSLLRRGQRDGGNDGVDGSDGGGGGGDSSDDGAAERLAMLFMPDAAGAPKGDRKARRNKGRADAKAKGGATAKGADAGRGKRQRKGTAKGDAEGVPRKGERKTQLATEL